MLLLIGQVARRHRGREAFQEVDYRRCSLALAKWTTEVDDRRTAARARQPRLPTAVVRAARARSCSRCPRTCSPSAATSPTPGPTARCRRTRAPGELEPCASCSPARPAPLVIVGGGGWTRAGLADTLAFAEAIEPPGRRVVSLPGLRGQPLAGVRRRRRPRDRAEARPARIREADLVLAVGTRLGEATTSGYTLLDVPRPRQRSCTSTPDAEELGRVYQPDVAVNSGLPEFAAAAAALTPVDGSRWAAWTEAARADYLESLRHRPQPGELDLGEVIAYLRETAARATRSSPTAPATSRSGAHRYYQFRRYRTQLGPTSGAMGYGVPAAVAAEAASTRSGSSSASRATATS